MLFFVLIKLFFYFRLTAFVIKSYSQAKHWIDIDLKEVESATSWLLSFQDIIGCFPTLGALHNKAMKSKIKRPVTMTTYVFISLLEVGFQTHAEVFRKASRCITGSFARFDRDSYTLSLMAYLFAKLKYESAYQDTMILLDKMSVKEGICSTIVFVSLNIPVENQ